MRHFELVDPHLLVEIYYLSKKEGGRSEPVHSGYRGQIYFKSHCWDAAQAFIGQEECLPGQSAKAFVKFASAHTLFQFNVGDEFKVFEGAVVVGRGVIIEVLYKPNEGDLRRMSLYNSIDAVLWSQWDPIGVNEFPEARDEYYPYVYRIFSMMLNNASIEQLSDYLMHVETDRMGLFGNVARCDQVAQVLLKGLSNKTAGNTGLVQPGP